MRRAFAFVAVGVLLFAGLGAMGAGINQSVASAGDQRVVENETFQPQAGQAYQADDAGIQYAFYPSENVTVEQDGLAYTREGNYTWDAQRGVLTVTNDTGLDTGTNASVTYEVREATNEQRLLAETGGAPLALGDVIMLVMAIGVVLAGLAIARGSF
jgi:ribosomal protein S28E/S33